MKIDTSSEPFKAFILAFLGHSGPYEDVQLPDRYLQNAAEALAAYESVKPNEDFFETFQRINTERQSLWCEDREVNPLFFAVELGGEVGEALNEVKKLEREKLGWRGSRTTIDKLADELADVIICTQNLANCYGIDLREAVTHKFNVTSDKVGFSQKLPALNKD
jgi:NTP pyrophosphatase (non-canonical NTP hydrolase)